PVRIVIGDGDGLADLGVELGGVVRVGRRAPCCDGDRGVGLFDCDRTRGVGFSLVDRTDGGEPKSHDGHEGDDELHRCTHAFVNTLISGSATSDPGSATVRGLAIALGTWYAPRSRLTPTLELGSGRVQGGI